jgi:hypothetical protein
MSAKAKDVDEKYKVTENLKTTAKTVSDDVKLAGGFLFTQANLLYRGASQKFCATSTVAGNNTSDADTDTFVSQGERNGDM